MTNPLLEDWDTPFQIAPFDRISDDDFAPAFDAALQASFTFEEASLDLSALATSTGTGQLFFSVFDDAALDLPALDTVFGGRFFVSSGGRINANASTWTLNSASLLNNNYELARASGASSILDLSGLASLDASFNSSIHTFFNLSWVMTSSNDLNTFSVNSLS